jgi:hypothetical protein
LGRGVPVARSREERLKGLMEAAVRGKLGIREAEMDWEDWEKD